MTQRVPSAGFCDNIVEDHSYTMFSMYPPVSNLSDPWQLTKEEKAMVRGIIFHRTNRFRQVRFSSLIFFHFTCGAGRYDESLETEHRFPGTDGRVSRSKVDRYCSSLPVNLVVVRGGADCSCNYGRNGFIVVSLRLLMFHVRNVLS